MGIWKDEWAFWTSNKAENILDEHSKAILIGIARKNLAPIRGMVDLVDVESEIVPGIKAVAAPGHTPGHMALEVISSGEKLLCYPMWLSILSIWKSQNGMQLLM